MVAQERVTRLLQPWLGAAFLQRCDLAQQAADTLNGWRYRPNAHRAAGEGSG